MRSGIIGEVGRARLEGCLNLSHLILSKSRNALASYFWGVCCGDSDVFLCSGFIYVERLEGRNFLRRYA